MNKNGVLKMFYSSIFIFLLVLVLLNTYLYIKQPSMIFFPIKDIAVTPKHWDMEYEDIQLNLKDKTKISAWYLPHPEATKTLLFFHGNGGNISHRGDSLTIFYKLKLNVLIMDYPGYGESEGQPSEQMLYETADVAWQYLLDVKKTRPTNIIIFGRSLGGAVAVDLASRVKAGGLIVESTFSSVRDVVNTIMPRLSRLVYLRYSFNSLDKITKVKTPILSIHSPNDEVIPFRSGVKLYDAISSEKQFLEIKGGHNEGFIQSISPYMQTLRAFLKAI